MGLFDKFTDTIIFKTDSELRSRYDALNHLIQEYPNNDDLTKEYQIIKAGLAGEDEIEYQLKKSHVGMYVLRDVKVRYEDLTAQIDYVVLTPVYTYLIECKNLTGNIIVDEKGDFIREIIVNGKKVRKGMYSPLRQVEAQKEVLRKIWENTHSKLAKFIFSAGFDKNKKVLVVVANKDTVLNTRFAPKDIKYSVIRADSLVKQIQHDIDHVDAKEYHFSKKDMEKLAQSYLDNLDDSKSENYYESYKEKFNLDKTNLKYSENSSYSDVEDIDHDQELRDKLIRLRKYRSKGMNIPAYYIFSNDELDKLVKYKPMTLDELKKSNILPAVKVNSHGELIVNVINGKAF